MAPATRSHCAHFSSRKSSLNKSARSLMFLLFVASITHFVTGSESLGLHDFRLKRNVFQLCFMVTRHATKMCAYYIDYGCYCGLGTTSTGKPVDDVDECCRKHDDCYGKLSKVCPFWWPPQFVTYDYDCKDKTCTCTDSPTKNACDYSTCQCDLLLGQCLTNTTYNSTYFNIDKEDKEKICHHS